MPRLRATPFSLLVAVAKSPLAWLSAFFWLLSLYSFIRSEFAPELPALVSLMPLSGWVILALVTLNIGSFDGAYRLLRKTEDELQPPLVAQIHRLLTWHQARGFEIRKRAEPKWEKTIVNWYRAVIADLGLIFGQHYATIFDAELGRKEGIKQADGTKHPKLIERHIREMLDRVIEKDLRADRIVASPALQQRLSSYTAET